MEILEDRWLSAMFARPVFRLSLSVDEHPAMDGWRDHAHRLPAAFYYARVESSRVGQVRALNAAGFHVVDVAITLTLEPPWPSAKPAVPVSTARPEEEGPLAEIAGRCFTTSRFHRDPLIPKETADRIKREWISNYFRGTRGERLYSARIGSTPAGFLAVLAVPSEKGTVRVIDLIGVDPAQQGRGVGTALLAHFIREEGPRSLRLEVGTQGANTRSLRLYERMGFRTARCQYVLHRHVPELP